MRISDWSSDVCSSDLFFNGQKGFGFIVRDDGGEDVFVHISAVEQAGLTGLAEGQPLGFTLVDRGGKVSATDLKIEGEPLPVTERAPREPRAGGFGDRPGGGDRGPQRQPTGDRKSVVEGKSVSVRVDHGGCRTLKKKTTKNT